jgi:hypothetical protein
MTMSHMAFELGRRSFGRSNVYLKHRSGQIFCLHDDSLGRRSYRPGQSVFSRDSLRAKDQGRRIRVGALASTAGGADPKGPESLAA